jgi:uncharacterized protein (TIGR02147 family)
VTLFESNSYRAYLRSVLAQRVQKNPRYSMRSFAKSLGVQVSQLSELLRGKRELSESRAVQIADKLGMSRDEAEYFRVLTQAERTKDPLHRKILFEQLARLNPRAQSARDLSVDRFVTISDWYHFAILRLLEIPGFQSTAKAVAKALGLKAIEAEAALERMERLDLVERQPDDTWKKVTADVQISSETPNSAIRRFHTQLLEKTIQALEEQTPAERFTGTETIALSKSQLKAASAIYEECFQKILRLAKVPKPDAEVYHLGIHSFRLSNIDREGVKK